eukprot:6649802-Pyramimonas_sp.AAC.1
MAVRRQGTYVEYSVEYSKRRALNGILVLTVVRQQSTVELKSKAFWPSASGLGATVQRQPQLASTAASVKKREEKGTSRTRVVNRAQGPVLGSWEGQPPAAYEVFLG